MERHRLYLQTTLIGLLALVGCAQPHYHYGTGRASATGQTPSAIVPNPIRLGGAHPHVDRLERVVQAPRRAVKKWFADDDEPGKEPPDPDQLRQTSVDAAQEYFAANGLNDVNIDIRCYAPSEQWARIRANDRIAPVWKYTGGTLSLMKYSLLPGRAFHSDNYDPFSNTLHLNSTKATSALYEAALAKEYQKHRWLGTYAVAQHVPFVPLVHHSRATSDVLTYANHHEDAETAKELYTAAYAGLGQAAVSEAMFFVPAATGWPFYVEPLIGMAAGSAGGITGDIVGQKQVPAGD